MSARKTYGRYGVWDRTLRRIACWEATMAEAKRSAVDLTAYAKKPGRFIAMTRARLVMNEGAARVSAVERTR